MARPENVFEYIDRHPGWAGLIQALHTVISATELVPAIKWGIPSYTLGGKNVLGIAAFKQHCALWFYNGVYLSDPAGKLINANEEATRGMRQWRFEPGEQADEDLVRAYVLEAIENQRQGKEIKPQTKELVLPEVLKNALDGDADLRKAFQALSPGKQREYAQHIASAKMEATQRSRLEKCQPMIEAGAGLQDKYR